MHRGLHLAAVGRIASSRRRVVGAPQLDDVPCGILHDFGAGDEVRATQAHFPSRREPEELLRRHLAEIVLLDVQDSREGHLAGAGGGVLGIVDDVDLFDLAFRVVGDDDLQRAKDRHDARRVAIQVFADAELELRDVDDVLFLGDADALAEIADRLGRVAPASEAADRRHPRIVPSRDVAELHQLQELALAHHGVIEIQPRELDLLRPGAVERVAELVDEPVVQRPVILEFERAQRVRDALNRVRQRMREVVHRIDAPGVARPMMRGVPDAIERRVAHVEIRRRHVDLRAQDVRAVFELARAHPGEEVEVLRDRAIAVRDCSGQARSACRGTAGSLRPSGCPRTRGLA